MQVVFYYFTANKLSLYLMIGFEWVPNLLIFSLKISFKFVYRASSEVKWGEIMKERKQIISE